MAIFDFKSRFLRPMTSVTLAEARTSSLQASFDSRRFESAGASAEATKEQEKGKKTGKRGVQPHSTSEVSKHD
jgi:hypothetical protein